VLDSSVDIHSSAAITVHAVAPASHGHTLRIQVVQPA